MAEPVPVADPAERLGQVPLFAGLPAEDLRLLEQAAIPRSYRKGQVLFLEGEPGDALYVVQDGAVKIYRSTPAGDETVLDIMTAGDAFGEMALISGQPRSASAATLAPSRLLALRKGDFAAALERRPRLGIGIIELLARRLAQANERLEDMSYADARLRVIRRLAALARKHAGATPGSAAGVPRLTHQTLAQLAGTARETVSRLLVELQQAGVVRARGGEIEVPDVGRLVALAGRSPGGARASTRARREPGVT